MTIQDFLKLIDGLAISTQIMLFAVVLSIAFIFREILKANLWDIILVVIGKKKIEELRFKATVDYIHAKVVYAFPKNCMIDTESFFRFLTKKIAMHREKGETIVFDLSDSVYCNDDFIKRFKEVLEGMIKLNNILCSIVFPKNQTFSELQRWLEQETKNKKTKSIRFWTDKRRAEDEV